MTYVTKVERLPLEGIASVRPQRAATALRDHVLPMGGAEGKFPPGMEIMFFATHTTPSLYSSVGLRFHLSGSQ